MSVPEELARREDRLARIAEAKAVIEARAEKAKKTGRKPGGRPPEPPVAGPGPKDQVNLTDADSRIMPVAGGGFEQAYNAQALVAADSLLVVTNDVVQAPNDKRQIEPALEARPPSEALGAPETLLADSGYFSEANVNACASLDHARPGTPSSLLEGPLRRRAAAPGEPDAAGSDDTSTGRRPRAGNSTPCASKRRNRGIIKSAMGFRQFSLRGLDKVTGEWNLVTLAWNENVRNTLEQRPDPYLAKRNKSALRHARAANVALTRGHKSILTLRYARPSDRTPPRKALSHTSLRPHSFSPSVRQVLAARPDPGPVLCSRAGSGSDRRLSGTGVFGNDRAATDNHLVDIATDPDFADGRRRRSHSSGSAPGTAS